MKPDRSKQATERPNDSGQTRKLEPHHREELRQSGLTDETIEQTGIYSADAKHLAELLNRSTHESGGWVVPFRDASGAPVDYACVKPDHPRHSKGRAIKYECPQNTPTRPYFCVGFDHSAPTIIITEGFKKAEAIRQAGHEAVIALMGVWAWQKPRPRDADNKPHGERSVKDDLKALSWDGKTVYLAFDSDAAGNPTIQQAEEECAKALRREGAVVRIVRIPQVAGLSKVSADDFLRHFADDGPKYFEMLLQRAREPRGWDASDRNKPSNKYLAEDVLASKFSHPAGQTLRRYRHDFYEWRDGRHTGVSDEKIRADVRGFLGHRMKHVSRHRVAEVIAHLEDKSLIEGQLDPPLWVPNDGPPEPRESHIIFRNGAISLDEVCDADDVTVELIKPHDPRLFSLVAVDYDFDPAARCPTWEKFVAEVFEEDEGRIHLLQEALGYLLTTDTTMQAIFLLVGVPRSGKSTTMRVLRHVIGGDNCAETCLYSLGQRFGLAPLLGKSVTFISDAHLPKNSQGALETLKAISGEDAALVDRKHKDAESYRLKTRFVIGCNQAPAFRDPSNALVARLRVLRYDRSFEGKEDRDLTSKLIAEAPGIFLWGIRGLRRLRNQGHFTEPVSSRELLSELRDLHSPVRQFLVAKYGSGSHRVSTFTVYDAWRVWADDNGHGCISSSVLGTELASIGVEKKRCRIEGTLKNCYVWETPPDESSNSASCGPDESREPNPESAPDSNGQPTGVNRSDKNLRSEPGNGGVHPVHSKSPIASSFLRQEDENCSALGIRGERGEQGEQEAAHPSTPRSAKSARSMNNVLAEVQQLTDIRERRKRNRRNREEE